MASGHGKLTSIFSNSVTNDDITRIKAFNHQVKSGVPTVKAWENTMKGATTAGKNAVVELKRGNTSMKELEGSVGKTTGSLVGAKVATVALNMAISFGLMWAIQGLITLFQNLRDAMPTVDNTAKWLKDSAEEVKKTQDEISTLNSKLKETKTKISELENRKGTLTFVEEKELSKLKETNSTLERSIALKERSLAIQQGSLGNKFEEAVRTKAGSSWGEGEWQWWDYATGGLTRTISQTAGFFAGNESEQFNNNISKIKELQEEYKKAQEQQKVFAQNKDDGQFKYWENEANRIQGEIDKTKVTVSDYAKTMQEYLDNLGDYDYSKLPESQQKAIDYANYILDKAYALDADFEKVFSSVFNQSKYKEAQKSIEKLKKSENINGGSLESLYKDGGNFKEMVDYLQSIGVITDTTSTSFQKLAKQILDTDKAAESGGNAIDNASKKITNFQDLMSEKGTDTNPSFVENTEKSIEKLQKLQEALSKLESGTLTDKDKVSLFKSFPELTAYANNLGTGIKNLLNSMRGDIVKNFSDKLAEFKKNGASAEDIAQLEAYRDSVLGIADAVDSVKNKLDSMRTVFKDLDSVVKNYNENGYFSIDSLEKLATSGRDYLQYLTYENGQLKVNENAYKKLVLAQIDEIETKATLQATNDLASLANEATAKEYLAKVNLELASSQLSAAQAAFQYQLALKLAEGGNIAKAAQKVADNLNTLRNIFATARKQAVSYSGAMLGAATATEKKSTASNQLKTALENEEKALERSKKALEEKKKVLEESKNNMEKAKNAISSLIDWTTKYIKQIKEDEITALEKKKNKFDELIESQKKQLQAEKDLHEYEKSIKEKSASLASASLKVSIASLDDSSEGKKALKKAQDDYKKSQSDLHEYLYSHEIEVREKALDQLKTDTDKSYQNQIDKIRKYVSDEAKIYRDACNMIDNDNGALYKKLLTYCQKYTTTSKAEFDHMWSEAHIAMDKYKTGNMKTLDLVNSLQNKIYGVDTAINTITKSISNYETQINNLKNRVNDLKDAAVDAKNAVNAINDANTADLKPQNNKIYFWVKYNGQVYKTAQKYDADTKANRLLAAPELLNKINKATGGNLPLSYVQGLLGVADNNITGHHWTFKYNGKTYTSNAADKSLAISDIRSQIARDYGNSGWILDHLNVGAGIKGYAEGTKSALGGLSIVDEEGLFSEFIPYQLGKGRYSFLPEGNPVFSKAMTDTLFDFASNPSGFANNIINNSSKKNGDMTFNSAPTYHIHGNVDDNTLKKIDKQEKERYEMFKKQFMLEMLREKNNL